MNCVMSPALPGSDAPGFVAGYVPSGSADPESQLLHIPFPDVIYRLQSHWHGDGGSVWLLSTDHNLRATPMCQMSLYQIVCHRSNRIWVLLHIGPIFHHVAIPNSK